MTLSPHLARLRAFSRICVSRAIVAEQSGQTVKGFKIRRSTMRCAAIMRAQSTTMYGALAGGAIFSIEMVRPGGGPAHPLPKSLSDDQRAHIHSQQYISYVNRIGHPEEAKWVSQEFEALQTSKSIVKEHFFIIDTESMISIMVAYIAGAILLANILWFLAIGGFSYLIDRAGRGKPVLSLKVEWIASLALLAAALILLGLSANSMTQWTQALAYIYSVTLNLAGKNGNGVPNVLIYEVPKLLMMAVPILTSLTFIFLAAVTKASPVSAMTRAMGYTGLVMLFLYSLSVIGVAQRDRDADRKIDSLVVSETRYAAQLDGKTWPAGTPSP